MAAAALALGAISVSLARGALDASREAAARVLPLDDDSVIVERSSSPFGTLFVVDRSGRRSLRFGSADGPEQSVIDLADPANLAMPYLRPVALVAALGPAPERILLIGLGGGGFVHHARAAYPRARIDAVEIDPVVVDLARRHFGIVPGPRLRVHVADGALFVREASPSRYDLIFLDAYSGDEIPPALASPAFLRRVRGLLRAEGTVVANVGGAGREAFLRAFETTFPDHCGRLRAWQDDNLVLVGSTGEAPSPSDLAARARSLDASVERSWRFETIARSYRACGSDAPPGAADPSDTE